MSSLRRRVCRKTKVILRRGGQKGEEGEMGENNGALLGFTCLFHISSM